MKSKSRIKSLLLTLSAIASTTIMAIPQAKAVSFEEQPVDQAQFVVAAVPFGYQEHRLEIIEQIPGQKQCWSEFGTTPVNVNLTLLDFDYTDNCRRVSDNNGYTLRLNGQDEIAAYVVKIVRQNGELQLVALHKDPAQPNVVIGRTHGLSNNAMKIILNPGWQISKRVHQGQVINHLYLSGNTYSTYSNQPTTSSTSANGSSSSSTTVIQGTGNTNYPQGNSVDTQVLVDSVEQIYNNVVNPLLRNLSQENVNSNNQ